MTPREKGGGGWMSNLIHTGGGGALLFHSFLQTGKVVEELLEFKYQYKHWNKTDKFMNAKVF